MGTFLPHLWSLWGWTSLSTFIHSIISLLCHCLLQGFMRRLVSSRHLNLIQFISISEGLPRVTDNIICGRKIGFFVLSLLLALLGSSNNFPLNKQLGFQISTVVIHLEHQKLTPWVRIVRTDILVQKGILGAVGVKRGKVLSQRWSLMKWASLSLLSENWRGNEAGSTQEELKEQPGRGQNKKQKVRSEKSG